MKKLLVSASALVALAVSATPAYAVPADADATATVRVLRPLSLTSEANLNLQTVVLSGPGAFTATVGVDQEGNPTCGAGATCSGVMTPATYRLIGANDQEVTITVASTLALDNTSDTLAPDLTLTVDAPASINLGADGNDEGVTFNIGGSISVTEATADGLYEGTFAVTAEYE